MRLPLILLPALALLLVVPAYGGGPRYVTTGAAPAPMRWNTAGPVLYQCETGSLGALSNAQATALVAQCFQPWQDVSTSTIAFEAGTPIPRDINTTLTAGHYS